MLLSGFVGIEVLVDHSGIAKLADLVGGPEIIAADVGGPTATMLSIVSTLYVLMICWL